MSVDEAGNVYGRWTVIQQAGLNKRRCVRWLCRCSCGSERAVDGPALRNGASRSCGCLGAERRRASNLKHGLSQTPTYASWQSMLGRCYDPRNASFAAYGGCGVTVCERWKDFLLFLADMGPRPDGKTLDRIENSIGYEPSNCRWSTLIEQQANRSVSRFLVANGEALTVAEWARRTGIDANVLRARIRMGWADHDIVNRPVAKRLMKACHGIDILETGKPSRPSSIGRRAA